MDTHLTLRKLFDQQRHQASVLLALAIIVGVIAGLYAVLFREMIAGIGWLAGHIAHFAVGHLFWLVVIIPALGGLIVGPLTYFLAREAKGHGVPEVINAVLLNGGRIRLRVIAIKGLASATSIGTGGSVGREGPIVQMGAGIGSALAQWFHLSEDRMKTFVGCGAAAGISATFNAPIAGAMFALEIILGDFNTNAFSLVVISSVVAAAVSHSLLGNHPAFVMPVQWQLVNPLELVGYALLGVLAGTAGVFFSKAVYWSEDRFESLKAIPPYVLPAFGGLFVGLLGLAAPGVLGVGYDTMGQILLGNLPLTAMLLLFVGKIVATALTLGSGGSGGVFAPSLFIGTALGGVFGYLLHSFFPTDTAGVGAYALVGMAAVVAGSTQAPITATLIIFEMTRDYGVMLPLLISVSAATLVSMRLSRETIYTTKLLRRGINVRQLRTNSLLRRIRVQEAMATQVTTVSVTARVGECVKRMQTTGHTGFPVIDEANRLVGILTLQDVRACCPDEPERRLSIPVAQAMTSHLITVTPDQSLEDALALLDAHQVGRLPVVDRRDPTRLVGVITRTDILRAYHKGVQDRDEEAPRLGA